MVETNPPTSEHGEHTRAFIGAYAGRFVELDAAQRCIRLNMAELDRIVGELIDAAVAHELRATAEYHRREAEECDGVAEALSWGER